ncbi:MFS transporter [Bradyrhizobium diazoefficiens]|nr:MFS transporter [Bradyrhizobium diazoefficiens]MBR0965661.1 MFS transporter [Bradyrhizobium diazoefficiens]MBR0979353.1 MFS transporter [Bradyrhizobium diazoefficiens]MBR1008545.1 MFS transporter [Bradyrhizobium diazoefficiens]MBR1014706.1 MFS transporter [Bradyrhizobium diazoefficiens]MBR1052506.1 MFS transporter [Bradyrhizobium diazoefficiens]
MEKVSSRSPPIHYGWIILAAGTFGSFMTLPGQTAGVSVFFDPITADLHISRTAASIAYALGTLAGILPAPTIGRWIDRNGPRMTATIIAVCLAAACVFMATVQSALMLLLGFALLRGAAIGGLSLVSQQVVNLWFVRRRGIAAAAASLGLAAGSFVFPKLIDSLITHYGWRGAYLILAGLVAVTILPVAALLFRDRPEKYGLSTDAGLPPSTKEVTEEPSFTRAQALRTGVFWLMCAAGFLTNAIGTALLLNHFSIMRTAGIAHATALLLLSLLAAVQAASTLGTGYLLDRYEPRRLVPLAMLMLALASALPAFGSGIVVSILYAICLGGAYGSQQAIGAAGNAQYFGRDHLGAIKGTSFVFGVAGAAVGPLPFAASVETIGSYSAALIACCMLCVACGTAAFVVKRPRPD